MFCGKCGTENPSNYSFCSACGFPLRSVRLDAPDATAPTAAGRDDTHATVEPAQLAARAPQPAEQAESSKARKKENLLHWLLWWRIDQDELNKQVAEYESMRITRSAKGQSFLFLILSACVTTAFIVSGDLKAVDFSDVLIALVLGYFIYRGHRWATMAAMIFWSIEKWAAIWNRLVVASSGNFVVQLVWWCICMHAFYLAFRVEGLRTSALAKTDPPVLAKNDPPIQ